MKFYMVIDTDTQQFYRSGRNRTEHWVSQDKASSWTTLYGPAGVVTEVKKTYRLRKPAIVVIETRNVWHEV